MILSAAQVENLQNNEPPTDWSKFDQTITPTEYGRGMFQGDDKLHVEFFVLPKIDVERSNEVNRPIFKDVPYIKMMIPGDKHNIVVEPVWDQHKQRFPVQWDQFKRGEEQQIAGTPLKVAPFLTPAHVAELTHLKIHTIEQLADLPDSAMVFLGAQEFKQAAKRYIALTSNNGELLKRLQALEAQLAEKARALPEIAEPEAEASTLRKNFGKRE